MWARNLDVEVHEWTMPTSQRIKPHERDWA